MKKVTFVVPVFNGEKTIEKCLSSIFALKPEIYDLVVVDDASNDRTASMIKSMSKRHEFRIISHRRKLGISNSRNDGILASRSSLVATVDADAFLDKGWLKLLGFLRKRGVAAVGGVIRNHPGNLVSNVAGFECEYRYLRLESSNVTKVSSTNAIYRVSALKKVGLFDPKFSHGEDTEISYRLKKAGFNIVVSVDIGCAHLWKTTLRGFLKQQYLNALGKVVVYRKHREFPVDEVSSSNMVAQLLLTSLLALSIPLTFLFGPFLLPSLILLSILLSQTKITAFMIRRGGLTYVISPLLLILRNFAWLAAALRSFPVSFH